MSRGEAAARRRGIPLGSQIGGVGGVKTPKMLLTATVKAGGTVKSLLDRSGNLQRD